MKSILFTSFLCLVFSYCCVGQAFLVLESKGKIKTKKYPIGSLIRVHLKDDPRYLWEKYTIQGLDLKHKCIQISDEYCLPLSDIDGFDISPVYGNGLARVAKKFFIQWTFFSAMQAIFRPPVTAFHFIVAGTTALVWCYSKLFLNGQKKINPQHRLRLIDLTVEKPKA